MTSYELATIYTDLVNLHDEIPEEESASKDAVGSLRSKYHNLLMDQFRSDGIIFADRFEAMRIAFEMVNKAEPVNDSKPAAIHSLLEAVHEHFSANAADDGSDGEMIERCSRAIEGMTEAYESLKASGWKPKESK